MDVYHTVQTIRGFIVVQQRCRNRNGDADLAAQIADLGGGGGMAHLLSETGIEIQADPAKSIRLTRHGRSAIISAINNVR